MMPEVEDILSCSVCDFDTEFRTELAKHMQLLHGVSLLPAKISREEVTPAETIREEVPTSKVIREDVPNAKVIREEVK